MIEFDTTTPLPALPRPLQGRSPNVWDAMLTWCEQNPGEWAHAEITAERYLTSPTGSRNVYQAVRYAARTRGLTVSVRVELPHVWTKVVE